MRAFLAVTLPDDVHDAVTRGMGELRRRLGSARWVRPAGVHVTLRFLDDQEDGVLDRLGDLVAAELAALSPVEVRLGGGGFFPHETRPRVAWLGGSAPGMEQWAAAIERCAVAVGVPAEARGFSLHVTLARLERPWGAGDVETFVTAVGKWRLAPFTCREVVMMRSELGPAGAVYTPLRRFRVGA